MTLLTDVVAGFAFLAFETSRLFAKGTALLVENLPAAVLWALGTLLAVLGRVVAVVLWPVTTIAAVLLVVFSPVIYTVSYIVAPVFWVASLVPKLEVSSSVPYLGDQDR